MKIEIVNQIENLIKDVSSVLIAIPENASLDHLTAAFSLKQALLINRNIDSDVVCPKKLDYKIPGAAQFSPFITVPSTGSLTIRVDNSSKKLAELSYQQFENYTEIYLKAKDGDFQNSDVTFPETGRVQNYQLIITIGVDRLEDLAQLYSDHASLFTDTKKLALGINPSQEYFAAVNLIELNYPSLSELVALLLQSMKLSLDSVSATALLTGIMDQTDSFQSPRTLPQTVELAGNLMETYGANHQEVVKLLYKTKDFSLLKLWGRALARMNTLLDNRVLITELTQSDFIKTGMNVSDSPKVLKEIIDNISDYQIIVMICHSQTSKTLYVASLPHIDIKSIFSNYNIISLPLGGLYSYIKIDDYPFESIKLEQLLSKLV